MSDAPVVALLVATAVGAGVMSGAFFAFSVMVMGALERLPSPHGIRAMQVMNERALTVPFLPTFLGSALLSIAVVVVAIVNWSADGAPYALAGGLLYLVGVTVLTMAYHVPRNDAVARLEPDAPESEAVWRRYVEEWTRWNHVRGAAGAAAVVALALALHLG
jgi:uncharacterized membrane protein